MEDIGTHWPSQEEMLQHLLAIPPATEGPLAGDSPRGTDHWVMVVQDAPARLLRTQEVGSEHGAAARQVLQKCKDRGLTVTAAVADDAQSFLEAINAVSPQARCQAAHVHTVQHSWGQRKTALFSYRRKRTARGAAKNEQDGLALAKPVWLLRWSLLTQPSNLSAEDRQAMAALDRAEEGLVHSCRNSIRPLVHIFAHSHSAAPAKSRLQQLRQASRAVADEHVEKRLPCFDDHGEQA